MVKKLQADGLAPDVLAAAVARQLPAPDSSQRQLIAIAGPPASGKSTLAQALVARLNAERPQAALLPMDGFHLDNGLLEARGLLARKGAAETFDLAGFRALLVRTKQEPSLFLPTFDRSRELAIAASAEIKPSEKLVIVEGNYLLFDLPGWRDLAPLWDFSLFIEASLPRLRERLLARWRAQGLSEAAALAKCDENDLPNAEQVLSRVHKAKGLVDLWLDLG
jgi:fructokinase